MKNYRFKILLLCFLSIHFLTSCSDSDESVKYKKGILLFENLKSESGKSPMLFNGEKYTGPIVKYYDDGILEFSGNYKEGIKDGAWKYYHPDGKLKREETSQPTNQGEYQIKTYRSRSGILLTELIGIGEDTIHFKKYHHNGKLGQKLQNDGKRIFQKWTSFGNLYHYYNEDSIVYTIDTKTKNITHIGFFENGKRTGFWFKHYPNGNKKYERTYKSGTLIGKSIEYNHNGNIDKIWNYNDHGLLEGEYKSYYFEGPLFVSGQYDFIGRKTGTWLYYSKKGKKIGVKNYMFDRLDGYYEDYYSNGRLKEKGKYQNNRKVGIWYYYNKYGKFLHKRNEG